MQTFSVSPGTLAHWWKQFDKYTIDQSEWFARLVVAEKKEEDKRSQRYVPPSYDYPPVTKEQQFYSEFFFVINPKFVDYSVKVGLKFRQGGQAPLDLIKPVAFA